MDAIGRRNDQARARATDDGCATYTAEVVDYWPACVTCGAVIRYRTARKASWTCSCPGVTWRFSGVIGRSPERVEVDGTST